MYYDYESVNIDVLIGKTLIEVTRSDVQINFTTDTGENYSMFHEQDCCESVVIDDIVGDLQDLIGTPILMAEEVEGETPADFTPYEWESYTWTFYKLATIKGYVDIRWFGSSNGYYSESVSFIKHK